VRLEICVGGICELVQTGRGSVSNINSLVVQEESLSSGENDFFTFGTVLYCTVHRTNPRSAEV
jgi:hypothetical protein